MNEINIETIKDYEKYYQIAMDWFYNEKLTEEEYLSSIGDFGDYTPQEIIDEMCEFIRTI